MNSPSLWLSKLPRPKADGNKYDRGHCIVIGGEKMTGAARLAAESAARAGAGLVTIIAPLSVSDVYRETAAAHVMVEDENADRCSQLQDPRRNALVLGCGYGKNAAGVLAWLSARGPQALVLDADGLNAVAERPEGMKLLRRGDVLTPHAGEYKRLFGDKPVQEAAADAKCIIVLKGETTVITDGAQTTESSHASPYLASAGTGDVLAGAIGGFLAQGMAPFEAARAAVWVHGEAGLRSGAGLVASDLPSAIGGVIHDLLTEKA